MASQKIRFNKIVVLQKTAYFATKTTKGMFAVKLATDFNDLVEDVRVLLLAVVVPEVREEVVGEHAVQAVEQRVHRDL